MATTGRSLRILIGRIPGSVASEARRLIGGFLAILYFNPDHNNLYPLDLTAEIFKLFKANQK
jgi:hypothetical protein